MQVCVCVCVCVCSMFLRAITYMYVQSLNSSRTTFEPTFVAFYPCIGRRTNVTDHTCIYSVPLVQEWIFSYEDLC